MANKRFLGGVMNTTLIFRSQLTARNIHRIIKLVSLFVRTDNPDAPLGQIKFKFFQTTMLLDCDVTHNGHIDRLTTLPTRMTFTHSLHYHPLRPSKRLFNLLFRRFFSHMLHRNGGMDSPAHIEFPNNCHFAWPTSRYQIIQNSIGHFFVKPAFVPI
jgi:hypothetical protein